MNTLSIEFWENTLGMATTKQQYLTFNIIFVISWFPYPWLIFYLFFLICSV